MPGPLAAAGAISNPTRYAALTMQGEQFTGMCTQRSPYRDALTAYLVKKFYGGSRFDSIWDGLNREISAKLTDVRRPGSAVYNSNTIPPINSYFSWKYIQNGTELIRVLADCTDGTIRDITAGQLSTLITKSAGAGKARFLNVGTELFIGDGVDQSKILTGAITWSAGATIAPGTLIATGAAPGTMQMALGGITMTIVATQNLSPSGYWIYFDPTAIPQNFANLNGASVTFSGLTTLTVLNGTTHTVTVVSSTLGILAIASTSHAAGPVVTDTGQGTTGSGVTGGSPPAFSGTQYAVTADNGQQWKNYGSAAENWGLPAPLKAFTATPMNGSRYWRPNTLLSLYYAVLDGSQNVQVVINYTVGSGGIYQTGMQYPVWTPSTAAVPNPQTIDGSSVWINCGPAGAWAASTAFNTFAAILDSNQNLQIVTNGGGGDSGGSAPTWATAIGTTTSDGALTWTCLGPGVALTTASVQYSFSTTGIDGTVSTAAPVLTIQGPILGKASILGSASYLQLAGAFVFDQQQAYLDIWRTPQGQSPLLLEDQIGIDYVYPGTTFTYNELGIPDTTVNGGGALSAFVQAPIAHANDVPPVGLTGPVFHLQRVWGFVGNAVYYSNGPDAAPSASNGNTGWPPLKRIAYQGNVIKLVPITVQNGGILVFTTSGVFIIVGTGTASNPFDSTKYCYKVNLAGYDALDVLGTEIFLMEANAKVSSLVIEYPFNPQSGYSEVGFLIGDQFKKVTTGGLNASLFTPASTYVSWNVQSSGETAMYVADGGGHWFRMSMVGQPENSGILWSPIASVAGGSSAVQSVETSPGVFDLLIGPASSGPVLKRDTTGAVYGDNGTTYSAWDAKGVNLLCSTGQWTEVAHISAKSAAVGARPIVSVLLGEIAPSVQRPWNVLDVTSPDPPDTPRSVSVYSDRYGLAQNGMADTGDCILTKFDYGSQAVADELLDWGIYASTEDERKEAAEK